MNNQPSLFCRCLSYEEILNSIDSDSINTYEFRFLDGSKKRLRLLRIGNDIHPTPKRSKRHYYVIPLLTKELSSVISIKKCSPNSPPDNVISLLKKGRALWKKAHPKLWGNNEGVKKWQSLTDEQITAIALIEPNMNNIKEFLYNEGFETLGLWGRFKTVYLTSCTGEYTDIHKIINELKESIEHGKPYSVSWRGNYDYSIWYEPGGKATFSAEYKGMGNGHYYVLVNEKLALFLEDD
jgi:hypothetical protein